MSTLPTIVPQRLGHDWIRAHIPHQGSMCLLEEVLGWDEQRLRCRSGTHRAPDHPLRAHDRLGSACLIEYAAQATAIHGALLRQGEDSGDLGADRRRTAGFLASARGVALAVDRIDDIATDLWIEAQRLHGDAGGALYAFTVIAAATEVLRAAEAARPPEPPAGALLAQGRLSVRLQARKAPAAEERA